MKDNLYNKIPRVCAIHDLSAFGRCALTVVIPTLSALGVQSVPLPTALLSTHTGGYSDIYIRELSPDMRGIAAHWKSLGVHFDAIYSGFILDAEQGHIINDVITDFKEKHTLVLVDPVMGDGGKLYSTCTPKMKNMMLKLCSRADIITPNLTEACMLCSVPYPKTPLQSKEKAKGLCKELLEKLTQLSPKAAITGVEYNSESGTEVLTATAVKGEQYSYFSQSKIGFSYHGTGELFASVLLGLMLRGKDFFEGCRYAGEFVARTIVLAEKYGEDPRYGTALEPMLMELSHEMYEKDIIGTNE